MSNMPIVGQQQERLQLWFYLLVTILGAGILMTFQSFIIVVLSCLTMVVSKAEIVQAGTIHLDRELVVVLRLRCTILAFLDGVSYMHKMYRYSYESLHESHDRSCGIEILDLYESYPIL